ncbi:hypothetical protein BMS3Bbin16_00959 [archaeon BMS3Bbin16]|nr:hypothetical protein BMS3Bbin16_00959 [archaeon BMS3Bbin16]
MSMKYFRVFYKGVNGAGEKCYRVTWVYAESEDEAKELSDLGEFVEEQKSDNLSADEEIEWTLDYATEAPCMD